MTVKMKLEEAPDQEMTSRWAEFERNYGFPPPLVPIELQEQYLVDILKSLDFGFASGMGIGPLPFFEIRAYAESSGGLSGRDTQIIRKMSEAYVSGYYEGRDALNVPPWPVRDEKGHILDDEINEGHMSDG